MLDRTFAVDSGQLPVSYAPLWITGNHAPKPTTREALRTCIEARSTESAGRDITKAKSPRTPIQNRRQAAITRRML